MDFLVETKRSDGTIQTVSYGSAEECLRDIMRMIRVGFSAQEGVFGQHETIENTIAALRRELRTNASLTPADQLRLVTLEAEFHQQCGNHALAAQVLRPYWDQLKPQLDLWSRQHPLEKSGERKLLRQKLWVLLHYVFYDYRVTGQHKVALGHFLLIEKVIRGELETPDYKPHGTLALCNYFVGLCYRVDRGFVEAQRRMLAAQRHLFDRATYESNRTDTTPERKAYELRYTDLMCARILSGQAWIEMQQGQLLKAEQTLRTAQNCLIQSSQETIGVYIDSLLAMTVRRLTPFESPAYQDAMDELERVHNNAIGVHEAARQRCAFELVRGYLDFAEFGTTDKDFRRDYVSYARQWLNKVGDTPIPKAEHRLRLHEIRFFIVKGDLDLAEEGLNKLRPKLPSAASRQRGFLLMEAYLYIAQKEYENAADTVRRALGDVLPLAESGLIRESRIPDPVLEAECYVLLARIAALKKDYESTKRYLERWLLLAQFVENYYLHNLARLISLKESPFFLAYDYPVYDDARRVQKKIIDRRDEFERWLVYNARERYPDMTPEKFAKEIYGLDRTTLLRNFPELFGRKRRQERD